MDKKYSIVAACVITILIAGCSKKTVPTPTHVDGKPVNQTASKTGIASKDSVALKGTVADTIAVVKPVVKPKAKPAIPKVIVVSDAGAKRSVDGRLYYDMQGRRYWRSNKDGKYYLYNKSMHNDPAFKAPKN